jgi:hypothetical protein
VVLVWCCERGGEFLVIFLGFAHKVVDTCIRFYFSDSLLLGFIMSSSDSFGVCFTGKKLLCLGIPVLLSCYGERVVGLD